MLPRASFALLLGALCFGLAPAAEPAAKMTPADLDRALLAEIKAKSEIMKNLQYLSDSIGGRLTGSAALERANKWTAEKMKSYGLTNVRLEPWEIPYGWERGHATMKIVEPNTNLPLLIASAGWAPGTKGKVTGDVVVLNARTKKELEAYKGKLKNAVILRSPPSKVAPITDLSYLGQRPEKKDEPKKDEPKRTPNPRRTSRRRARRSTKRISSPRNRRRKTRKRISPRTSRRNSRRSSPRRAGTTSSGSRPN